jgi:hypothetical protein
LTNICIECDKSCSATAPLVAPAVGLVPTHLTLIWPHSVRYNLTSVFTMACSRTQALFEQDSNHDDELQTLMPMADSASHRLNEPPCSASVLNVPHLPFVPETILRTIHSRNPSSKSLTFSRTTTWVSSKPGTALRVGCHLPQGGRSRPLVRPPLSLEPSSF